MKKLALLTTIAAALTMVACNKASKDADALSKLGDLQGTHSAAASNYTLAAVQNAGSVLNVGSYIESYKLTGATVKRTITYYEKADGKGAVVYTLTENGEASEATIGGATSSNEGLKPKYVKLDYKDLVLEAKTDKDKEYVVGKKLCGITDVKQFKNDKVTVESKNAADGSCLGDTVGVRFNAYSTKKSDDGKKSLIVLADRKGYPKDTDVPKSGKGSDSIELNK